MKTVLISLFLFFVTHICFAQHYKILESNDEKIIVEINFENTYRIIDTLVDGTKVQVIRGPEFYLRNVGEPWLPVYNFSIGVPHSAEPKLTAVIFDNVSYEDKFIIPFPDEDPEFVEYKLTSADKEIYSANKFFPQNASEIVSDFIFRYARILNIQISPFQFNPVSRQLILNKKITVTVNYNSKNNFIGESVNDNFTHSILKTTIINHSEASNWLQKTSTNVASPLGGDYWYNPLKDYYKIYLKEKGVYRITYEALESLNVPIQGVGINKLEIFAQGQEVPLYTKDANSNGIFETGDYFEFVGYPPPPSPFSGLNIYNLENVVWFSYQADTTGLRYTPKDAYPVTWQNSYLNSSHSIHHEVDTLYERLGHAFTDQRDYWYWGKTSGVNGNLTSLFTGVFPAPENISLPLTTLKITVNMHGMTFNNCNPDHRVQFFLTGQPLGEFTWDGPDSATYIINVDLTQINLYSSNNFQVAAYGDYPPCGSDTNRVDEIRVNWFEIEYTRDHRANENNLTFKSPDGVSGLNRLQVFNWLRDDMKIFAPERNEMLVNPWFVNDQYHSVLFVDSLYERTEYFCVAEDFFQSPDSIVQNNQSDLRNLSNGSDYIIITHTAFVSVAERLANLRAFNFPDTSITNPRIEIVIINDIYDEFSFGLLNPDAIHDFLKYTFENWTAPAPAYVVLLGDMSYDYRMLIPTSRPNFIPAIPYHARPYGQAASDNLFVTVSGIDDVPDIAIGRLSCETLEEGNLLIDKLTNYPDDPSKKWRQNALLISSGQSLNDEQTFSFNDSHLFIDNNYIKPFGYSSIKVFRYPSKPEHEPFQGGTTEIREGFDEGAVITSYYGHGGGYQWDLVFTTDDIYELNNGGRLPFISSVTCYTAHFDNQDVFGEQFNKVPGKGSISFWGSSGLTFWGAGRSANQFMFDEIYRNKSMVSGRFILSSKIRLAPIGYVGIQQINLLTLLGDPVLKLILPDKPDFELLPSDITINPRTPVVNQNVEIIVNLKNYGRDFPGDSVVVQLFANTSDTSYTIAEIKHHNFGEYDSILVNWIPDMGGLYTLIVKINETEIISEVDHSDNETSIVFAVFDLGEPSIIDPINGFTSTNGLINFLFIDIGYYVYRDVRYLIEIDTSIAFQNPLIQSQLIAPGKGLLEWASPILSEGKYFWRARIIVEGDSTVWNEPRILSVEHNSNMKGYNISEKSLISLSGYNVSYSESLNSLVLNTDTLPPRPSNNTFEEFIEFQLPPDIEGISTITTDGTYIYYSQIAYYSGTGYSKIYKLGTGYNGTVIGQDYGPIPNLEVPIWHQMFYFPDNEGGHLYVATGDAYSLLRVNIETGDTSRIYLTDGMLNDQDGLVHDGAFFITSDGSYIYNLAYRDSIGNKKYKIRTFNPSNNWSKVGNDLIPTGSSFDVFRYFFVAQGYLYPYENYFSGYLRRINLQTGIFEEEWPSYVPPKHFYAWTYDWVNDKVYASVYNRNNPDSLGKVARFNGTYRDASGSVTSHQVGPAAEWNSLDYFIDDVGATGTYDIYLNGFNKSTRVWDTLFVDPPSQFDLSSINANEYPFLQVKINLTDTSFGVSEPIKIKSISIDYETPPELMVIRDAISFSPDTVLQGFNTQLSAKILNVGKRNSENVTLNYILSSPFTSREDSIIISRTVAVPESGSIELLDTLITDETIFDNIVSVLVDYPGNEFFTFNNIAENNFYVARDSARPLFKLTFDGQEIINEDIVSDKPEVIITLEDNSPLPLDTSFFTIVHTFKNTTRILRISDPDVDYSYTGYPNSQAIITWLPEFEDGEHTLEILAKDASGNFFDSTSSRTNFNVFSEADLTEVYNYPNPFANETHFTFQLRGTDLPDEILIKVYTIAGRLIRDISLSSTDLNIGFNKIRWDGKDQDGDEIGNGVYFYKMIAKFKDDTKSVTQKLAKVK